MSVGSSAVQGVGFFGRFGSWFSSFFSFVGFRRGLAVFILLLWFGLAVLDSWEQGDVLPLVNFVGESLSGGDSRIVGSVDVFLGLSNPDIVDVVVFVLDFLACFYMIYIWFVVGFWCYDRVFGSVDSDVKRFVVVFFVFWFFNFVWVSVNLLLRIGSGEGLVVGKDVVGRLFVPFYGVFYLFWHIPSIVQFVRLNKPFLFSNLFDGDVVGGRWDWVKEGLRFVGNFPVYVRENFALMRQDLLSVRKG